MGERALRPFWIHQLAEYLVGVALVSQGLQDPEPLVPVVAGTVVVLNTAIARGPLGAFKGIGRGVHKWMDAVVMAALVLAAVQPWIDISSAGRGGIVIALLPLGFLWFYTDWVERPGRRQRRLDRAGVTGEQFGRTAGRLAGSGYRAARQAVKNRQKP